MRILLVICCALTAASLTSCLAPNGDFSAWGPDTSTYTNYNDSGSGTTNDPYQIYTVAQMESLATTTDGGAWNASYQLMNDIDLTGTHLLQPIGNASTPFSGTFDGSGHVLANIQLDGASSAPMGVFGYVGGTIENLTFRNLGINAPAASYVGAIAYAYSGTILDVQVMGSHIAGQSYVGAVVGMSNGLIQNSAVDGTAVMGNQEVGGLAGNSNGEIENCWAGLGTSVAGTGSGTEIGGLVGSENGGSSITKSSYALAMVSGTSEVGGLIGSLYDDGSAELQMSYAGGTVSGATAGGLVGLYTCEGTCSGFGNDFAAANITAPPSESNLGGLIGSMSNGSIQNVYSAGSISSTGGANDVGGLIGLMSGGSVTNAFSAETSINTGSFSADFLVGGSSASNFLNVSFVSLECAPTCTSTVTSTNFPASYYQSASSISTITGLSVFASSPWTFTGSPGYPIFSSLPSPVATSLATKLVFATEPSSTLVSGVALSTMPVVQIQNASNSLVSSATNFVTLTAYANSTCTTSAGGTLSATVNPISASAGDASFTSVTYAGSPGIIFLGASSPALSSACSSAITISVP